MIDSRYRVLKEINRGSYGSVYMAEYLITHEIIALKLEKENLKPSQLLKESNVYALMSNTTGFAKTYGMGKYKSRNLMGLELLGSNLYELFNECNKKLSLKTVIIIALQLLDRLEELHKKGMIHRDIKPENVLIGRGEKKNIFYLTDFGLSETYSKNPRKSSLPPLLFSQVTGNQLFASTNSHTNRQPGPGDDLESLGYMLVYLLNGKLPWSGINEPDPQIKANIITNIKLTTSVHKLCENLPKELETFINEAKMIDSKKEPNYDNFREMFTNLFVQNNFVFDDVFDWSATHQEKKIKMPSTKIKSSDSRSKMPEVKNRAKMTTIPKTSSRIYENV